MRDPDLTWMEAYEMVFGVPPSAPAPERDLTAGEKAVQRALFGRHDDRGPDLGKRP